LEPTMRGRKNHGVRQSLWLKRRQRYRRRAKRSWFSGRKWTNPHPFYPPLHGRRPKRYCVGHLFKQPKLRRFVKRSTPWHGPPPPPGVVFVKSGGGRKHPPHWAALPTFRHSGASGYVHRRDAGILKVRRKTFYRGHQIGRLRGHAFFAAAARRYWYANGRAGYPSWDPDHRLPVYP
jgi:hypothetical protein